MAHIDISARWGVSFQYSHDAEGYGIERGPVEVLALTEENAGRTVRHALGADLFNSRDFPTVRAMVAVLVAWVAERERLEFNRAQDEYEQALVAAADFLLHASAADGVALMRGVIRAVDTGITGR